MMAQILSLQPIFVWGDRCEDTIHIYTLKDQQSLSMTSAINKMQISFCQ